MTISPSGKSRVNGFHYALSALLALGLVPCLKKLGLPVSFDWAKLASAYWLVLGVQSIFAATLLYLLCFPRQEAVAPTIQRLRQNRGLIIFWLAYLFVLMWQLGWAKAFILTAATVAILEFRQRHHSGELRRKLVAVFVPACYLFAGFLLVFAYNDVILSVRFFATSDATFNSMDQWLLFGASVSSLCHWAVRTFPTAFFYFLEFIYFGMFAQIGAALLLTSLYYGKSRGLRFVGAILTAYYMALALFYLWPSQGPYYLCPIHFSDFPSALQVYGIQKQSITNSQALWNHLPIRRISTDYYIAFPCMHVVQPLIALWFLRRWKRIVIVLAAYDLFLLAAILLLEWHYAVDIIGGVFVAIAAIAATDGRAFLMWITRREPSTTGECPA